MFPPDFFIEFTHPYRNFSVFYIFRPYKMGGLTPALVW